MVEAKRRKEHDAQEQRLKEIEFVSKLRKEIDEERDNKQIKKVTERE